MRISYWSSDVYSSDLGYASVLALAWAQNKLLQENLGLTQVKETLLRELQHRTKNNYQLIVSLVQFQAKRVTNIEARENLERICDRIQAMSSVQAQLYVSETTHGIDLGNNSIGRAKVGTTITNAQSV